MDQITMTQERDDFEAPEFREHRAFWLQQFEQAGEPFSLASRLLFAEPEQSARYRTELGGQAQRVVEHVGRGTIEGGFALVVGAVSLLLSRISGQERVVLELPAACSQRACDRPLLAIDIGLQAPLRELLLGIGKSLRDCAAFSEFHIAQLRDKSGWPARSDVLLCSADLHRDDGADSYHTLGVRFCTKPQPALELSSPSGLLPRWFLQELGELLSELLASFGKSSETQQAALALAFAPVEERLIAFNPAPRDDLGATSVVGLFERHVTNSGANIALIAGDRSFDYAWLNTQSLRLAEYLMNEHEVGPGSIVASLHGRSELAVVSLLAILRSGAAFLPLNPKLPSERIAEILEESGASALLLDSDNLELAMGCAPIPMFATDLQLGGLSSAAASARCPDGADTAYVIYTSGTTGRSKGVMVDHDGLANTVIDHLERFGVAPEDRYLQFMAASFDGFLLDVFTALASGACLIIAEEEAIADPELFMDLIERHGATISTVTPSYLQLLDPERVGKLRLLVSAGEPLPVALARSYASRLALYNGYGPTEASINTTLFRVTPTVDGKNVPIGKPSLNKQVHVIDGFGRPVPPGVIGEICIAGRGLAKGYLGDKDLTAQKFVENRFNPGTRLYRSGDHGAWTSDGFLVFKGRDDNQVKINGLRVDLTEIDRVLNQVCILDTSQVLVNETNHGKKELLAFYQPSQGMELVPSLGEYDYYDAFLYESMATDPVRVDAYRRGLTGRVEGKIALDPGTGSQVVLARHCVDAGAKRVFAIELDEKAAQAAEQTIIEKGLQEKIRLVRGDAASISELPEPVDLVVSALAGNIASSDGCIPLMNAIKRHLRAGVAFVPSRYVTRIAGFDLPQAVVDAGFSDISKHYLNELFETAGRPFDSRLCLRRVDRSRVLTDSGVAEDIDYAVANDTNETRHIKLQVERGGALGGFLMWIEAYGDDELLFDSLRPTHHLPVFIPLTAAEAIEVKVGDIIDLRFIRSLGADGYHPDYRVEGNVQRESASAASFEAISRHGSQDFRNSGLHRALFEEGGAPKAGRRPSGTSLRNRLAEQLPDYMLPHRLIETRDWPLTAHGKVDTAALVASAKASKIDDVDWAEPTDEIERMLCTIWSEVLELPRIGIDENLFGLGCDSIRVIQAVHLARQHGLHFSASDVPDCQTIHALADFLREPASSMKAGEPIAPPVADNDSSSTALEAIPATSMQQMMLAAYERDGGRGGAYHCCAIWRIEDETLDIGLVQQAIQILHDSHASLRTTFVPEEKGGFLQLVSPPHPVNIRLEGKLPTGEDAQDAVFRTGIADDVADRFAVGNRIPMVRFRLWTVSDQACAIMFSFHHALLDGWSGVELRNALVSTYASLKGGKLPAQEDPGIAARSEFVALEQSGTGSHALTSYLDRIAAIRAASLPMLAMSDAAHSGEFKTLTRQGSARSTRAAFEFAQQQGVTVKAVFLSIVAQCMVDLGLCPLPILGVVSNGRSERLTQPLRATGLFWNIVPIALDPADQSAFRTQQQLDTIDRLGTFPFSEVQRVFDGKPDFPTFNFVNFHNQRPHDTVRLSEIKVLDRFHFPLNVFVAIEQRELEATVLWRAEFAKVCFDEDSIDALLAAANARLERIMPQPARQVSS